MTTATLNPTAPREIRRALGRIAARLQFVKTLKGIGSVAVVAALGVILGMLADFAWPLPSIARWGIWSVWVVACVVTFLVAVVRPLTRSVGGLELAALAERAQPELEEQIVSSVALLSEGERTHGSRALIDALTAQAVNTANLIDARKAISADKAWQRLAVGSLLALLVAGPALIQPDPFGTLARRFLAPWAELDRVGRFSLRINPGDKTVALGADLPINAWLSPRAGLSFGALPPDTAWLEWDDESGKTTRVRMATKDAGSTDSRQFEAKLPRLAKSVRYRVVTDPVSSRYYQINAVEPPKIESIVATVTPPSYTKLPAAPAKDAARLSVIEGSTIDFKITTNRAVKSLVLGWPTFNESASDSLKSAEITPSGDGKTGTLQVTAEIAGNYTFTTELKQDEHGLDGLLEKRKLLVRADAPPVLSVVQIEAKEIGAEDVLTIPIVARDDFDVSTAELHYSLKRANSDAEPETGKIAAPLRGLGTIRAQGDATLGLKPLSLNPGDQLSYRVKIADNRPAPRGPNIVWSDEGSLAIVAKAEPILARQDRLHRERIQERLEEIKKQNTFNRQETIQLRYAADAAQRTAASWDKSKDAALAERKATARKVVEDLNALARDLDADPTYKSLARPAKEIAEVEAEASHDAIEAAGKATDAPKRLAELKGADNRLSATHQRIEELQRKFEALAKADADRQKLRELAAREEALAAEAAQAGDDQAKLEAVRNEQDEVRKELDALANQAPELKAGLLEAQAKQAAELAKKARELAEKQREEARKTGEGTKRKEALQELAEAQRRLEMDARRLALDIDQPLNENGRAGLNPQTLQNAVPPIERGEIAQGRQRLEEAENELRRLARDVEDAPADPKSFVRRLIQRQEELSRHVGEAVREARGKNSLKPEEQNELVEALKPLVAEQEAIHKLTEALKVDEPRKGAVRDAEQAVARALENLKAARPKEAEGRQNEAKQALQRLVQALPDPWQREEPIRKKLEDARRLADESMRDVDRHLRETAPQPGKPHDEAKAAAELANRLAPLAQKANEAATALAAMDVPERMQAHVERAERRAKALAEEMKAVKTQADALAKLPPRKTDAFRTWQVAAPFPMAQRPPFSLNEPIKPSAKFKGLKGKPVEFKSAKAVDDQGKLDLGSIYSKDSDQSAFAYTELDSPVAGTAKFSVGADDTLMIWVNGKQVYKLDGNHSYSPGAETFDVLLPKGMSRVVVRCGNSSSEWMFGMTVALPQEHSPELARVQTLRAALPQAVAESRAAMERLTQKVHHQTPSDEIAQELAAEQAQQAEKVAKPADAKADPDQAREALAEQKRLATALRSLNVSDAAVLQSEAVRLADQAVKKLGDPQAKPEEKVAAANEAKAAAKNLADRLTDAITPKEEAAALTRAERAMNADDTPADIAAQSRDQQAIAAEVARLEADTKPADPAKADSGAVEALTRAAEIAERATQPANDPGKPKPTARDVAKAREQAAARLGELTARLSEKPMLTPAPAKPRALPDAPKDPAVAPLAARAAEVKALAQRERQIREKLQAVLGERVAPQEDLHEAAAALGAELADLRDESRQVGPHGHGHANAAADLLTNQAPRAMEQGIDQLAQGQPEQARDSQRRAADLVERAAQAAEDLAQALKLDIPNEAGQAADLQPARDALAEARQQLAQEGKGPAAAQAANANAPQQGAAHASTGQNASQSMQRAAQAMRTAARSAQGRDSNGEPMAANEGQTLDPKDNGAGVVAADLTELQAMIRQKTGKSWGDLPGHLRTEILQLSQGKYRDDYTRLIQLYFKEIASDAAKPAKP